MKIINRKAGWILLVGSCLSSAKPTNSNNPMPSRLNGPGVRSFVLLNNTHHAFDVRTELRTQDGYKREMINVSHNKILSGERLILASLHKFSHDKKTRMLIDLKRRNPLRRHKQHFKIFPGMYPAGENLMTIEDCPSCEGGFDIGGIALIMKKGSN